VVVRDTTERQRAEEVLKESEQLLALAETVSLSGSWAMDLATQEVKWSDGMYPLFQLPKDTEDKVGAVVSRIHPDDIERYMRAYRSLLAGEIPAYFEHRIVWPDGGVRYLGANITLMRDANGKPTRAIGSAQDITERKQAEEEIRQLNADSNSASPNAPRNCTPPTKNWKPSPTRSRTTCAPRCAPLTALRASFSKTTPINSTPKASGCSASCAPTPRTWIN
jgi:PAS domain S-box-containing protein